MRVVLFCGIASAALMSGALTASAALAQTTAPESGEVSEIIVTAQKRAERLQDVPIAISQVTSAQMQSAGVVSFQDLTRVTSGLNITRTGPYILPGIRGISTSVVGILAENNVAVYVDGFYMTYQIGLNFALADVNQVEVLKGPQGTLFGRNATGGAILVTTLDPSLSRPLVIANASYGRFNETAADAYVSAPVGDRVAFSLAGSTRKSDGWVRDRAGFDSAPVDTRSLKAKLRIDPTDNLSLVATYKFDRISDPNGNAWIIVDAARAPTLSPGAFVETRPYHTSLSFPPASVTDAHQYSLKATFDAGSFKISALSNYMMERDDVHYDIDGAAADLNSIRLLQKQHSFSQEVNVGYRAGPVDLVAGAFYLTNHASSPVIEAVSNGAVTRLRNAAKGDTWAVFADGTFKATDRLSIIGGVRYSEEQKYNLGNFVNGVRQVNVTSKSWSSVTPRLALRYALDEDSNVYASVSKGFKAGVFNASSPTPVNPEKVTAYEVGYKAVWSRVRFDASTYAYNYRDMQINAVVEGPGGTRIGMLTNAASSKIYGAEAQAQVSLNDNLVVQGGVNYNHARFRDFPNGPGVIKNAAGFNVTGQPQDWSGKQLVHAPDWTLQAGAEYTTDLGGGELKISPNIYYTSSYTNFDNSLLPNGEFRYVQKGYVLVNGQVSWRPDGKPFTIAVFGRNLTNRTIKIINAGTALGDAQAFGEPRVFGVRFSLRWEGA